MSAKMKAEIKAELDDELVNDLRQMSLQVSEQVLAKVVALLPKLVADEVARQNGVNNNSNPNMALTTVTMDRVMTVVNAAKQEMSRTVYSKVINHLNTKVMPEVQKANRYLSYIGEDVAEVIHADRMHAMGQPDKKLLTDGKHDKRIITPHISTMFSYGDLTQNQ